MRQGRPLIFGEVLFDCFPNGQEVLGGAPFNVAWNLQAFGQQPVFISRVGDDLQGQLIKKTMTNWSMETKFLQQDMSWPTGRVEISLTNGEPKFTILPNQAYDHISSHIAAMEKKPSFLYHGTLALRGDISRSTLAALKRDNPSPIFLDVNLRNPWWEKEAVLSLIKDASWLKLNEDEYRTLFPNQSSMEKSGRMVLQQYDLDAVFITMGSEGAVAFTRHHPAVFVKPKQSVNIIDTVGAGDAFSSVLLLGLGQDWPLQITLERAQEFASAVVGQQGAITDEKNFYTDFFERWVEK